MSSSSPSRVSGVCLKAKQRKNLEAAMFTGRCRRIEVDVEGLLLFMEDEQEETGRRRVLCPKAMPRQERGW